MNPNSESATDGTFEFPGGYDSSLSFSCVCPLPGPCVCGAILE